MGETAAVISALMPEENFPEVRDDPDGWVPPVSAEKEKENEIERGSNGSGR
jgi:hypothetical protein